jgi:hypothetical protein
MGFYCYNRQQIQAGCYLPFTSLNLSSAQKTTKIATCVVNTDDKLITSVIDTTEKFFFASLKDLVFRTGNFGCQCQ